MLLRIAIVEDEKKAQDTLRGYLERFGKENDITFLIDVYGTPVMLLDQYKAEYNIIFLDIQMPDINGMDAARRIRAIDSSVVLIFVTSLTQYAIEGYEVEALDYIVKPVQAQEAPEEETQDEADIDESEPNADTEEVEEDAQAPEGENVEDE